jgi:hypothetical protein
MTTTNETLTGTWGPLMDGRIGAIIKTSNGRSLVGKVARITSARGRFGVMLLTSLVRQYDDGVCEFTIECL